ncbi:OmpA/MotB domain protein [Bacillus cereus]|nr:OmpA/MotB domain protein [Bacillus cereus]
MGSEVNDFEEVKFRVETAQKMVGSATISMDRLCNLVR